MCTAKIVRLPRRATLERQAVLEILARVEASEQVVLRARPVLMALIAKSDKSKAAQ
jgi:hypothetical protein